MEKKSRANASKFSLYLKQFALAGCVATLAACGGGGDSSGDDPMMFTLGVEVTGLTRESGNALILTSNGGENNGGQELAIFADGPHRFLRAIEYRSDYNVTVKTQPDNVLCSVTNGTGFQVTAEIPTILVRCSAASLAHTIGGTVSQLAANSQIVLRKGDELLPINSNGKYSFTKKVADKGGYIVSIATMPDGQKCDVQNPSRPTVTSNINDVNVVCASKENTFTVGGNVVGLTSGKLVIRNNDVDPLEITKNGAFVFNTPIASGSFYNVTAQAPAGQTCIVDNRSGQDVKANVSNILVKCSPEATSFSISGEVTGMDDGASITLKNNGDNDNAQTLEGNGKFEFTVPVSGPYNVTIDQFPTLQKCFVENGQGKANGHVTNVKVSCIPPSGKLLTCFPEVNVAFGKAKFYPVGLLLAQNGSIFGTTTVDVINNYRNNNQTGYIFKMTSDGVITAPLHWFAGSNRGGAGQLIADPAFPTGLMQAKNGTIYGGTFLGGSNFVGALFSLTTSNVFTQNLFSFANDSSQGPVGDLIQVDDDFYGVTYGYVRLDMQSRGGTIFKRDASGSVSTLYDFGPYVAGANQNGILPQGRLTLVKIGGESFLYGTTEKGGENGKGTIFRFNIANSKFERVLSFYDPATFPAHPGIGMGNMYSDPYSNVYSGLTLASDGNLYGVAKYGGDFGGGRIFKLSPATGVLSTVFSFAKSNGYPAFELVQLNHKLYGVTQGDGITTKGMVYRVGLQANAGLEPLYSFKGNGDGKIDGDTPSTRLVVGADESSLYVGTKKGGINDTGVIFKLGGI